MFNKGLNQVDLAVAVALMVVLFAFTLEQVSGYYSGPLQTVDRVEMRSQARSLWQTAFWQEGVPSDWNYQANLTRPSMGDRIWKVPIHLREYNGTGGNYRIRVPVEVGESHGRPKAWNTSVTAYYRNKTLPTDIYYDQNDAEDGFLRRFDLLFEVNIGDREEKTVEVYFSQDRTVDADYADLTESENLTVNVTATSERSLRAVSRHKASLMEEMSIENISNYYGVKHGFRMYLSSNQTTFIMGRSAPRDTDSETYSRSVLYQSKNGKLEVVEPEVVVW